jgi:hypothetical protein
MVPDRYQVHIWNAQSLHELGRTKKAVQVLAPAAVAFRALGISLYLYGCQNGLSQAI